MDSVDIQVSTTEAYIIFPLSRAQRARRSLVPLAAALIPSAFVWVDQYQHQRTDSWYYMLPLLLIGIVYSVVIWRRKEEKSLAGHVEVIPLDERLSGARIISAWTLGLCTLAWVFQAFNGWLIECWWYVWPAAVLGLGLAAFTALNREKYVLAPAAVQEEAKLRLAKAANEPPVDDRQLWELEWWFRYPLAVGGAWLAFQLYLPSKPVWVPIVLLIFAAVCGWELALLGVVLALLYGAFKVIALLPVSVAVIVGALIIAGALSRKKNG